MKKIKVAAPATTANIGPGFDTLGCAFALYCEITFEQTESGLSISGCPEEFQNEGNLAYRAYKAIFDELCEDVKGVIISIESDIPVSRGLGSSAAVLAAGAVAANIMLGSRLSYEKLLEICVKFEGHPDNLAPCLYGGFTASFVNEEVPYVAHYDVNENICFYALVPDYKLSTEEARAILPKSVCMEDAVSNISKAAVLPKALETGDRELIALAVEDRIHQPYRSRLIPCYDKVKEAAVLNDAYSFFISGSGSTCIALSDSDTFTENMQSSLDGLEYNWKVIAVKVDRKGTREVDINEKQISCSR